jgi:glycosyltransferase involved in cell wall biosynthesis
MKILMINKGDTGGGGYKVVWDLANGLVEAGHEVNMFVQDKITASPMVKVIPRSRWRFYLSHLLGTDFDWFKTDFILDTQEFKEADIVHINNIHSHYFNLKTLAKICELKPVVWTFHDLWPVTSFGPHPLDKTIHDGFYWSPTWSTRSMVKKINQRYLIARKREVYKKIKFNITVPSKYMQNMLKGTTLDKFPISLIYNGIDTQIFKPQDKAEARAKLDLPQNKKIFLFVANKGMANSWKGANYFSEVIKHFAGNLDVLFLCIGGNKNDDYQNVKFLDFINDSEILSSYYSAVDGLVFPSLAESFGLVVVEAISTGTPVIAFGVGIVLEAIEHKSNGYIADYQSSQSLIDGVEFIMSLDEAQMAEMRQANRAKVLNKFDKKIMVESFQRLYNQMLKNI